MKMTAMTDGDMAFWLAIFEEVKES